jgi:hypothetical protein
VEIKENMFLGNKIRVSKELNVIFKYGVVRHWYTRKGSQKVYK